MAKLSARGRYTLATIEREFTTAQLQARHDHYIARAYPDGTYSDGAPIGESTRQALTVWELEQQRLMSDGQILSRRVVRFQPDPYDPHGRRHDYGWKVLGKAKPQYRDVRAWLDLMLGGRGGRPSSWRRGEDR